MPANGQKPEVPQEKPEVPQEHLDWKTSFEAALHKMRELYWKRHKRLATVAEDIYGSIPTKYLDDSLQKAWEKYYIEEPDMRDREQRKKMRELKRAFVNWGVRHNMIIKTEMGDPLMVLWYQIQDAIDRRDMATLDELLGLR